MSKKYKFLIKLIQDNLTDDLRRHPWRGLSNKLAGHCYVACETLYHLTNKSLKPHYIKHENSSHWFLKTIEGAIIDPTASQFSIPPNYFDGIGKGFLTKQPSARTQILISRLTK